MKKLLRRSCGAFTMAEILISLTIIGVIAAITLPSLRANINEKTWATQKKALFSRMSQGIAMLDAANTFDNAQAFVTEGLSEVLKINNICDGSNTADCGITSNIITMAGSAANMPLTWGGLGLSAKTFTNPADANTPLAATSNTLVSAFETQNGESVLVFYNPDCIPDNDDSPSTATVDMVPYVCANMIFDLNQDKGPNTMGKDIGYMTVLYASDSVVATGIPGAQDGTSCSDTERLPNLAEAVAMELNSVLLPRTTANLTSGRGMALTTGENPTNATWYYGVAAKTTSAINRTSTTTEPAANANRRCVKR